HIESEVEYGIALFNGTGVGRNEGEAAGYFLKAAKKSNPIAQNRRAWMYATGRGIKADPVEAGRWHLIARAGGNNDQYLTAFIRTINTNDRDTAGDNEKR